MIFEEALLLLRKGFKITNKNNIDDEYWIAGYISIGLSDDCMKDNVLTLHKFKKKGEVLKDLKDMNINNTLIMNDDWEILNEN